MVFVCWNWRRRHIKLDNKIYICTYCCSPSNESNINLWVRFRKYIKIPVTIIILIPWKLLHVYIIDVIIVVFKKFKKSSIRGHYTYDYRNNNNNNNNIQYIFYYYIDDDRVIKTLVSEGTKSKQSPPSPFTFTRTKPRDCLWLPTSYPSVACASVDSAVRHNIIAIGFIRFSLLPCPTPARSTNGNIENLHVSTLKK